MGIGMLRRHRKARGLSDDEPADELPDDLSSLPKDELVEEAEERGLEVVRRDGKDGAPLKDDYIAALEGDESALAGPEEEEGGEGDEASANEEGSEGESDDEPADEGEEPGEDEQEGSEGEE